MSILPAAKGEDVQLVEFGDLFQKLLAVWPQAGVQHGFTAAQLEVEDALEGKRPVSTASTVVRSQCHHQHPSCQPSDRRSCTAAASLSTDTPHSHCG